MAKPGSPARRRTALVGEAALGGLLAAVAVAAIAEVALHTTPEHSASDRDAVALIVVRALLAVVGLNHSDTDEIVTLAVVCGLLAAVARLVIRRQR